MEPSHRRQRSEAFRQQVRVERAPELICEHEPIVAPCRSCYQTLGALSRPMRSQAGNQSVVEWDRAPPGVSLRH